MMNILALSLFITSLTTASIFSPNPKQQPANTIVKEGHRVVVVEYDQDGYQNTKISISPEQQQQQHSQYNDFIENTKDKIKETASVLPNIGQGISQHASQSSQHYNIHTPNPTELICDAYGKCKNKITNVMEKAKDKASETIDKKKDILSSNKEAAKEVGNNVINAVDDVVGKAKEKVYDKANDVQEYTKESLEKGKEMGQTFKEHVVNNMTEAKDGFKKFVSFSMGSVESMMSVLNLLGFASGFGMNVWITFISSYVLSRVMPRQQFAVVQSKIYPVYFRVMGYCLVVALLGHVLGHGKRYNGGVLQSWNLLGSLLTVFVNSVYLEPRATKLMFERMKQEKEEGRGREDITTVERSRTEEHQNSPDPKKSTTTTYANVAAEGTESQTQRKEHDEAVRAKIIKLNNKLKRLNSYSSFLNILNLMSLTWHLVYLAQNVNYSC